MYIYKYNVDNRIKIERNKLQYQLQIQICMILLFQRFSFLLQWLNIDNGNTAGFDLFNIIKENVDQDDDKTKKGAEQKPYVNILDIGSGWQAGGDRDVQGRQHHHAGDDGFQELGVVQIVGGLIDDVHEDGGQVGTAENTSKISPKLHSDLNTTQFSSEGLVDERNLSDCVLSN